MNEAPAKGFRCSDGARERGDRSVGTAPPARNWFLVEQDGNWGPNAWSGLDIDDGPKDELEEIIEDADARLMLIRRPGNAKEAQADAAPGRAAEGRRWCLIRHRDHAEPEVIWGRASDTPALLDAARLFEDPDSPVQLIDSPASGPGPEIILVCTHGRKDVCCAVRGRPVAAKAAELWPQATWECTHTGGDRFAANLLLLPDGACYGGLDPALVEPIVTAHLDGRVDPAHLRGKTGETGQVQAAVVEMFARFAPLAFNDVRPLSRSGGPDEWQVRLEVAGVGEVEVTGHTAVTDPEFLTCKADVRKVMHLPVVDEVTTLTPAS